MTDQGFQIVLFWAKAASPWPVFRLAGVAFVFVALCWGVRCGLVCFRSGPLLAAASHPGPPGYVICHHPQALGIATGSS